MTKTEDMLDFIDNVIMPMYRKEQNITLPITILRNEYIELRRFYDEHKGE